jgi:hypothetical protein
MDFQFQFPEHRVVFENAGKAGALEEQWKKIQEECLEVYTVLIGPKWKFPERATRDLLVECMDVMHATETFIRLCIDGYLCDYHDVLGAYRDSIVKNQIRGYYIRGYEDEQKSGRF